MESSIAVFLWRRPACERLPTTLVIWYSWSPALDAFMSCLHKWCGFMIVHPSCCFHRILSHPPANWENALHRATQLQIVFRKAQYMFTLLFFDLNILISENNTPFRFPLWQMMWLHDRSSCVLFPSPFIPPPSKMRKCTTPSYATSNCFSQSIIYVQPFVFRFEHFDLQEQHTIPIAIVTSYVASWSFIIRGVSIAFPFISQQPEKCTTPSYASSNCLCKAQYMFKAMCEKMSHN